MITQKDSEKLHYFLTEVEFVNDGKPRSSGYYGPTRECPFCYSVPNYEKNAPQHKHDCLFLEVEKIINDLSVEEN